MRESGGGALARPGSLCSFAAAQALAFVLGLAIMGLAHLAHVHAHFLGGSVEVRLGHLASTLALAGILAFAAMLVGSHGGMVRRIHRGSGGGAPGDPERSGGLRLG